MLQHVGAKTSEAPVVVTPSKGVYFFIIQNCDTFNRFGLGYALLSRHENHFCHEERPVSAVNRSGLTFEGFLQNI